MKATYEIAALALLAFLMAYLTIPYLIKWAYQKGRLAQTNHRSSHQIPTPALGGVSIFAGFLLVSLGLNFSLEIWAILIGVVLLFVTGWIDDMIEIRAKSKLAVQIVCAVLIYFSGLQIDQLHGIFGIHEIPHWTSFALTVLFIVGVTNAFNLIDGINGLAGSLAVINGCLFGLIFYSNGQMNYALLAFTMSASVLGFLPHNFPKAKIFMGDTGSLFLGLLMSVFVIKTLQTSTHNELSVSLALVPMFIPIFDTLRLFITRLLERKSPMEADKNHLHHLVVNVTLNHTRATLLIILFHVLLIAFVVVVSFYAGEMVIHNLLMILLGGVVLFMSLFVGIELYNKIQQLRAHLRLLTNNNRLLEKL